MNKVKEILKKVIACIAVCAVFVGGLYCAAFLVTDNSSSYTRVMMHEFYRQDNIDILFTGTSHCFTSINPEIMDEKLGCNTFNAASSGQKLDTTSLVVQETIANYDVKEIYVELSYNAAKRTYRMREEFNTAYVITDYMRPSKRKYDYIFNMSEKDNYVTSILPVRRDWDKLFDAEYVGNVIKSKCNSDYLKYGYKNVYHEYEHYVGKGHIAYEKAVPEHSFFENDGYKYESMAELSPEWAGIVKEIIDYCDTNGVKLTFFLTPESSFISSAYQNHDEFHDYIQDIVDGTNADFIDFSLMKENYWTDTTTYYKDDFHLNEAGAEVFSNVLADYLNGNISDEELFYGSMKEKLDSLAPALYGISYATATVDGNKILKCKVVSNKDNMEYAIEIEPENGEAYIVQAFDNNNFFELPVDQHGLIHIEYRLANMSDVVDEVSINY